jgi:hypothetical protein
VKSFKEVNAEALNELARVVLNHFRPVFDILTVLGFELDDDRTLDNDDAYLWVELLLTQFDQVRFSGLRFP